MDQVCLCYTLGDHERLLEESFLFVSTEALSFLLLHVTKWKASVSWESRPGPVNVHEAEQVCVCLLPTPQACRFM